MNRFICLLLALAGIMTARAGCREAAGRPVTSVYGVEVGGLNVTSTYLSPLPYTGWSTALYGAWGKEMRQNPEHLVMDFRAGIETGRGLNPAKSAEMLALAVRFSWGPSWRKKLPCNLQFTLGAALDIFGGVLYLPRNGNNPASAMAYAGLDLTAGLQWKTRFGHLPVTFADRAMLPTAGAFFMPGYEESYYEIYLGNHGGLAHFGWWGNAFGIDNHLTMTLHFGRKALELGYRLAVRTNHANNLTTQYVRNSFTVAFRLN